MNSSMSKYIEHGTYMGRNTTSPYAILNYYQLESDTHFPICLLYTQKNLHPTPKQLGNFSMNHNNWISSKKVSFLLKKKFFSDLFAQQRISIGLEMKKFWIQLELWRFDLSETTDVSLFIFGKSGTSLVWNVPFCSIRGLLFPLLYNIQRNSMPSQSRIRSITIDSRWLQSPKVCSYTDKKELKTAPVAGNLVSTCNSYHVCSAPCKQMQLWQITCITWRRSNQQSMMLLFRWCELLEFSVNLGTINLFLQTINVGRKFKIKIDDLWLRLSFLIKWIGHKVDQVKTK